MELGLTGKKAVVTGATRGIGRAIVERFVAEGMRVVAVDTFLQNTADGDERVLAVQAGSPPLGGSAP